MVVLVRPAGNGRAWRRIDFLVLYHKQLPVRCVAIWGLLAVRIIPDIARFLLSKYLFYYKCYFHKTDKYWYEKMQGYMLCKILCSMGGGWALGIATEGKK